MGKRIGDVDLLCNVDAAGQAVTAKEIGGIHAASEKYCADYSACRGGDIVLMDLADYRELPYFFGMNHCVVTIKIGNIAINRLEQP